MKPVEITRRTEAKMANNGLSRPIDSAELYRLLSKSTCSEIKDSCNAMVTYGWCYLVELVCTVWETVERVEPP